MHLPLLTLVTLINLTTAIPYPVISDPTATIPISTVIVDPSRVFPTLSITTAIADPSWAFPTISGSGSGSSSSRSSHHRNPHSEPIPTFIKSCDCKSLPFPEHVTADFQRCEFENSHSWACWMSANYGCPSPTKKCSELFPSSTAPPRNATATSPSFTIPVTVNATVTGV